MAGTLNLTAFTFLVNGVARAIISTSVSGLVLSLVINDTSRVVDTDTVTLTYVVPGTGRLVDIYSNPASGFTAVAVANITAPIIVPPDPGMYSAGGEAGGGAE